MQQTLFTIPHSWFQGQLLIGWLVICCLVLGYHAYRKKLSTEFWNFLPVALIVSAVIYFVFPLLEVAGVNPEDPTGPLVLQGLAIRGYGVFLLLAIVAGISVVLSRCQAAGFKPDQMISLTFWMTICGIVGARTLYVVQKSDEFFSDTHSFQEGLFRALKMTEGGLVVYGSLIGGVLAALVFFQITKLSFARAADVLAPGMMLGLAIGRLGCLMNGCCYGGVCEPPLPGLEFPAGSPAYMQQLQEGELVGLVTEKNLDDDGFGRIITEVQPDSLASRLGLVVDDRISIHPPDSLRLRFFKQQNQKYSRLNQEDKSQELVWYIKSQQHGLLPVSLSQLAPRAIPVHPTQIYSAINAGLMCLLLWFYWTIRSRDGEVFALMLILYSIGRFLLELIRNDEAGIAGTSLTISQWVSIGTIMAGFAFWAYIHSKNEPIEHLPT